MMITGIILAVVFVLDAFRLRTRICQLKTASQTTAEPPLEAFALYVLHGTQINDEAVSQMVAHAETHQLDVLDAVPGRWHASAALSLAQLVDLATYRKGRLAKGRTAGVAVLVRRTVIQRMINPPPEGQISVSALVELSVQLKLYACTSTDFAVIPSLPGSGYEFGQRRRQLVAAMGSGWWFVPVAQVVILAGLSALTFFSPVWGGIALGAFSIQPLLATMGTPIHCWDAIPQIVTRPFLELASCVAAVFGRPDASSTNDPVPALRPVYEALAANGLDSFYEERRTQCPLCQGSSLSARLKTTDIIQRKPGQFTLDQCADCQHIFQNPRLSIEGLNYYYKDFYDGLGEEGLDAVFGYSEEPYLKRARMLSGQIEPQKWLDVGAGHGHFCCVARDVWPNTKFDALDLSESVEEATRRGWADTGHRGLFPEMANTIKTEYDVVSMSHYLEHTREPDEEIEAANIALREGGILFIEVPDPECKLGRFLGRYWVPWFQPQHQHLLSTKNLEIILNEKGFEVVAWHHGEAHQPVDFFFATYLQVNAFAPPHRMPWSPELGSFQRLTHRSIWLFGSFWLMGGWLADRIMAPILSKAAHSNTYRVIARKVQ